MLEHFPSLLFCPLSLALFFSPLCPTKSPSRGDSASFENHYYKLCRDRLSRINYKKKLTDLLDKGKRRKVHADFHNKSKTSLRSSECYYHAHYSCQEEQNLVSENKIPDTICFLNQLWTFSFFLLIIYYKNKSQTSLLYSEVRDLMNMCAKILKQYHHFEKNLKWILTMDKVTE